MASFVARGSFKKFFLSIFNQDTQYSVDNYALGLDPRADYTACNSVRRRSPNARCRRNVHRLLPLPLYLAYRHDWDTEGIRINLADGGHTENLGVVSLIKRACDSIIVVDSEADSLSELGNYRHIKRVVEQELGMKLAVAEYDNFIEQDRYPKRHYLVSRNVFTEGAISGIPLRKYEEVGVTKLYWAKLGLHPSLESSEEYQTHIQSYIDREDNEFPHDPTEDDQSFDERQFQAYRYLGFLIGKSLNDRLDEVSSNANTAVLAYAD